MIIIIKKKERKIERKKVKTSGNEERGWGGIKRKERMDEIKKEVSKKKEKRLKRKKISIKKEERKRVKTVEI